MAITGVRTFIPFGVLLGAAALIGVASTTGGQRAAAQTAPAVQTGGAGGQPGGRGQGQTRQAQPSAQEGLDRILANDRQSGAEGE